MRILITGAGGFVGRCLVDYLISHNLSKDIVPLYGSASTVPKNGKVCNLTDSAACLKLLKETQPTQIFHFAGMSRVSHSISIPEYFSSNFLITQNLLKALLQLDRPAQFFFASSAHVYGNHDHPVTEEQAPQPVSHYGFTKFLAEQALKQAAENSPKLRFIIGRLYTCIGPSQSPGFVAADFATKLANAKQNGQIEVGPLNTGRQFTDVRDIVPIIFQLMQQKNLPNFDTYNLTAPTFRTVREVLDCFLKISQKNVQIKSVGRQATSPFAGLRIDTTKLMKKFPNATFRPIDESLKDVYEWTVKHCGNETKGSWGANKT